MGAARRSVRCRAALGLGRPLAVLAVAVLSGFASALADVDRALREGRLGPGSATRAVLLGYAHGTQFAHLLAFERPDVPFAASVLLDSICLGFDDDHAARLVAALAPGAGPWPAEGPYQVGCDVLQVPGVLGHLDLGDVVSVRSDGSVHVPN